jgi:hypothetical protein
MLRISFALLWAAAAAAQPFPVHGIHLAAPQPEEIPLAERFILKTAVALVP